MPRRLSPRKCAIETLESRCFLSAQGLATPQLVVMHAASSANLTPIGYTPGQIRAAYGFNQVAFIDSHGANVAATGAGQTIAIIDAFNDPNIASDVANFSQQFGLPQFNRPGGPTLRVESQSGSTTALPPTNGDWAQEIALDVEWAHAIAPGANILLVEANSDNLTDLLLATNHAKVQPAVSVISISWDTSEFRGETSWDSAFLARRGHIGQTFVAAAGDDGSPPEWPAVSPWVLSVGATTLNVEDGAYVSDIGWVDGGYASETGWGDTSGGVAQFETEPSFQARVQSTGFRSAPDVAYDGDPDTGMAVYNSVPNSGPTGWAAIGGTSAGVPQWAALIAIADQGRALRGLGTLSNAQSILYNLPATDYHDIATGNNGSYSAGTAYDGVTGLGSPLADMVIQHLVWGIPPASPPPVSGNTGVVTLAQTLLRGQGDRSDPVMAVMHVAVSGTGTGDGWSGLDHPVSPAGGLAVTSAASSAPVTPPNADLSPTICDAVATAHGRILQSIESISAVSTAQRRIASRWANSLDDDSTPAALAGPIGTGLGPSALDAA